MSMQTTTGSLTFTNNATTSVATTALSVEATQVIKAAALV